MVDDFGWPDLVALIVVVAEQRELRCDVLDADEVRVSGMPGGPHVLNIANLRRVAYETPRDQWSAIVADFLGTAVAETEVDATHPLDTAHFDVVRPLIMTRLYPPTTNGSDDVVARRVAPGITQILLIDQPMTVTLVHRETAAPWPMPESGLWALAERNTRAAGRLETVTKTLGGVDVTVLYGSEDYASAHARWLDDYPVLGPWGALFIVPCEGMIYTYPITGLDVVDATNVLARLATTNYRDRPRQISPFVYWWHRGRIDLAVETEFHDDRLTISPSDSFLELLSRVAP